MTQEQHKIILAAQDLVRLNLGGEPTGHDFYHVQRVVGLAQTLAKPYPHIDGYILTLACWLHDIDDRKIVYHGAHVGVDEFMLLNRVDQTVAQRVKDIIDNLSYSSSLLGKKETTLEGQIAQDADRLDALGAIGIARAFAYGGNKGRLLVDPTHATPATVDHFAEKLFKLEALMNTPLGKTMAHERSAFMKHFIATFEKEVDQSKTPLPSE